MELDWYVATTAPAQEIRARRNLQHLGIASWLPRYSKVMKQAGHDKFVERMLFPGYVFIAFEPGYERWMTLREVPGLNGIIAAEGCPERIPADKVAALMARCLTGYFDQDQRRVGSKVRILAGDHRGQMARIVNAAEADRVTVLLSMCGTHTFARIALDELKIAA